MCFDGFSVLSYSCEICVGQKCIDFSSDASVHQSGQNNCAFLLSYFSRVC